ncbi:MAG: zf-HC2 domain-containing protein [Armatimonadota bacterium]|jgi:hypothetical protein
MRCRKVKKLLPLYEDGGLPARVVQGIETHLADCTECGREARELDDALGALRAMPRMRPAPEFKRAVIAAVRREAVQSRQGAREWVIAWQPAFAAAAVTACVLLGAVAFWMHGRQTPSVTPAESIAIAPIETVADVSLAVPAAADKTDQPAPVHIARARPSPPATPAVNTRPTPPYVPGPPAAPGVRDEEDPDPPPETVDDGPPDGLATLILGDIVVGAIMSQPGIEEGRPELAAGDAGLGAESELGPTPL